MAKSNAAAAAAESSRAFCIMMRLRHWGRSVDGAPLFESPVVLRVSNSCQTRVLCWDPFSAMHDAVQRSRRMIRFVALRAADDAALVYE